MHPWIPAGTAVNTERCAKLALLAGTGTNTSTSTQTWEVNRSVLGIFGVSGPGTLDMLPIIAGKASRIGLLPKPAVRVVM
jgi:hypothetical protein